LRLVRRLRAREREGLLIGGSPTLNLYLAVNLLTNLNLHLTLTQSGSELIAQAGGAACEEAGPAAIVVVVREIPSRMPNFAYPLFLLLALAVPLVVWLWLRRRRRVVRLPGAEALDRLPGGRARLARWSGAGLRAL